MVVELITEPVTLCFLAGVSKTVNGFFILIHRSNLRAGFTTCL
jgi:hypothetical protein